MQILPVPAWSRSILVAAQQAISRLVLRWTRCVCASPPIPVA
jgi:hypothetical protein